MAQTILAADFIPKAIPDCPRCAHLESLINTPETNDFDRGVELEAAHQKYRWGAEHDDGKNPFDWFWLVGYLSQKAATAAVAGNSEKARHHIITTAAALRNWFSRITDDSQS